jgi:hypothetical protein
MQRVKTATNSPQTGDINRVELASDGSRARCVAIVTMTLILCVAIIGCCGPNDPNCRNISFGPSGAEVAGIGIAVGAVAATVIAVEVHHAHHTLDGCVSQGPAGMQLQTHGSAKTYLLSGNTTNITVGQRIRFHGTRLKQLKHSTADPTFLVERETKDYGPCKVGASSAASP